MLLSPGRFQPPRWQQATQIWPWQHLAFCCHGAEAVSVVWATCARAHGSLINVMYRRNRSGEQEVLAKKKIDRAPLVLGMPCCIKSCLRTLAQTYTCTLVQMCMQPCIQIHLAAFACKHIGTHAVITNRRRTDNTDAWTNSPSSASHSRSPRL